MIAFFSRSKFSVKFHLADFVRNKHNKKFVRSECCRQQVGTERQKPNQQLSIRCQYNRKANLIAGSIGLCDWNIICFCTLDYFENESSHCEKKVSKASVNI